MFLEEPAKGGGRNDPACCGCKEPIREGDRAMHVRFNSDPTGEKGLTGEYHLACGKAFKSIAHVMNMNP